MSSAANHEPRTTDVVCANVALDGDAVLLVLESKPQALGRWALPGGRLETDETLAEAAAREAREETGLEVEVGPLVGIYHTPLTLEGASAVIFVFSSTVVGGILTPSPEHPEARFVGEEEFGRLVAEHRIRGRHVTAAVASARAGRTLPPDLIELTEPSPPPTDPAV